jgi:hypothetical protein
MANKESKEPVGPENDDFIKYLGFGVYPGKIEEFWTSDDEEKQYRQVVKARGGKVGVLQRETSILNTKLMSKVDRIISYIGSILLVVALFFTIYSLQIGDNHIYGSALSYLMNIGTIVGGASESGFILLLAWLVFTLILIACPVAGVINFLGLLNKAQGDEYLEAVKKNSRFLFIPMLLFSLFILLLLIGSPMPRALSTLGSSFGFGAIFTMTGAGFWLLIAGLAIGFAERRGI